ncbi:hypothetical protein ACJJTC_007480 [Scirpophaga incertulas]
MKVHDEDLKRKFTSTLQIVTHCPTQETFEIETPKAAGKIGKDANLNCSVSPETVEVHWVFQGTELVINDRIKLTDKQTKLPEKDQDGNVKKSKTYFLNIINVTNADAGEYTCVGKLGETIKNKSVTLDLSFPGKLVNKTTGPLKLNVTIDKHVKLYCLFEVYNKPTVVKWYQNGSTSEPELRTAEPVGLKQINSIYDLKINANDSGIYVCEIVDSVTDQVVQGEIEVIVYAPPQIVSFNVIPINTTQLYINWTVEAYNSPIEKYNLLLREIPNTDYKMYYLEKISPQNKSFVINGLKKSTEYQLKLEVQTANWTQPGKWLDKNIVQTLDKEPIFVPNISINGFSATSVTIGWPPPPKDIADLIHYYKLNATKMNEDAPNIAVHYRDGKNLPYMFGNLEPHSTYVFQVQACSDYSKLCGPWSEKTIAATLDGIPGKPSNVKVNCSGGYMNLTWDPPEKPNAEIKGYTMELTGNATYKDRYGTLKEDMWGPLSRFTTNSSKSARFDDLVPNSNYTVRVSAMTRTRRRGDEETRHCTTPPAAPDSPPRPRWRKILDNNRYLFKLYLPRISERNGRICCYRVYMVRMLPNTDWKNLADPRDIGIVEYAEAHAVQPVLGAYITDVFSNEKFPSESDLIMGDSRSFFDPKDPVMNSEACRRCLMRPIRAPPDLPIPTTTTTTTTAAPTTTDYYDEDSTGDPIEVEEDKRAKRSPYRDYTSNPTMRDKTVNENFMKENEVKVNDSALDSLSNYTLFVELIPGLPHLEPIYSKYVGALMPAPSPATPAPSSTLEIALQATCAVAALVLVVMVIFCAVQARRTRKLPPHAPLEMNRIQAAFRYVVGHIGGRQHAMLTTPPDMPPIAEEDLAAAYAERQADSDYGFQKEFEMLPECFPDRSTHASEARENQPKNRYPDIKAYDQTRVRLAALDGVPGSDYINANYVMGYRERKQFICAQGPTETTVNDFWRMIWEHGLELIVMLTNLEEYSKIAKTRRNRALQHSPREVKESSETRTVRQYHFLMWKDFAAPEHPHSILKFIKRVNEAWSNMVGRPVVVHCSAGVGRTGTLVALDCLLDQLRATRHAAVFNTVAELRRQRNFLVQSLKQYVFVYRALVEYAHYGDTEIPAGRLKASVDRLRNTPDGGDSCLMDHEFQKIINSPVAEIVKSCSAGAAEEVRTKNRSPECLPYDRNRVILTPLPGREFSTYINASFIEAYDNSEGFIITQDPLPTTILDFWRMVSEHNVSTIVMLSEIGEGKCPRYWDDGTAQYEHISVQYEESESCPYYTRRQFRVTNNKNGDTVSVRQLQYQGWPTAPGHVPEVTRGLAELADAARLHQPEGTPMLVHCHLGAERAALFVALCILICQLRVERRVDVCALTRKMRSQREHTLNTFLQYEFLHRAILNYAELHNLLEDS